MLTRPRTVLLLLVVVGLSWGAAFWWNSRNAPVESRIEAGTEFLTNGQIAAAESQWQEATRLDPNSAQAWELLGDLYFNIHNYKEGQEAFAHAIKAGTDSTGVEAKAAYCALQAQDLETARRFGEAAVARNSNDIMALEVLAQVEKTEQDPEAQLKILRHLVALQPQDVNALIALATELALDQNFDQLLPVAQKLVEIAPDSNTSYFLRGLAYFNSSGTPQADTLAKADFLKAIALAPDDAEPHRFLGRLYLRENHPREAVREYQFINQFRPFASAHLFELSRALRLAGRTQEADQTQALFNHLKEVSQQIANLRDRAALSPKDPTPVFQLMTLLLGCIQGSDADFQLYRYRYLNNQLHSLDEYANRIVSLARPNTPEKRAGAQLEAVYMVQLHTAERKLQQRDFAKANGAMARVILIRPRDTRTLRVLARFSAAHEDPLGTLPPPSPNSVFFK